MDKLRVVCLIALFTIDNAIAAGAYGHCASEGQTDADPAVGFWRNGFSLPGACGVGARVDDIQRMPDGSLVVCGIFERVAGTPAHNIARWTRSAWERIGGGLDGWVRAIVIVDGVLWAGGQTDNGGGFLARQIGRTWQHVPGSLNGGIRGLAPLGHSVVAVGNFEDAGGSGADGVAVFDGERWLPLGTGDVEGSIEAIAANGRGVCVAGRFTSISGVAVENAASWDGWTWRPLGAGLPDGVDVLTPSPSGTWFAGGTLTFSIDPSTREYEAGIAFLDSHGKWQPFEGGIDGGWINEVRAIAFDGEDVIVGGCFENAGKEAVPARNIARWRHDRGWEQIAGGLVNDVGVYLPSLIGPNDIIAQTDGVVWVGGVFSRVGEMPAVNVAKIRADGTPRALLAGKRTNGIGGWVNALATSNDGKLIAGGFFAFAGTKKASSIAVYEGTKWTELGHGIQGNVNDIVVKADGTVAVAGSMLVDGMAVAFAAWDGHRWDLRGGPVTGIGYTLVEDGSGALWLGGDITDAGGTPVASLARLDGAGWHAPASFDGPILAATWHDNQLIVAGLFTTVDGKKAKGMAAWNGAAWSELGGGLDGDWPQVYAMASSPTLGVIVGGHFDGVNGKRIPHLARWDGTTWHGIGGGPKSRSGFPFVSALLAYGDGLFVAGGFDRAGNVSAQNIAWFDGASWHDLGGGLADLGSKMIVCHNTLFVGGPFLAAGGVPSSGVAAWDFSGHSEFDGFDKE